MKVLSPFRIFQFEVAITKTKSSPITFFVKGQLTTISIGEYCVAKIVSLKLICNRYFCGVFIGVFTRTNQCFLYCILRP